MFQTAILIRSMVVGLVLLGVQSELTAGLIITIQPDGSSKSRITFSGSGSTTSRTDEVREGPIAGPSAGDTSDYDGPWYPGGTGNDEVFAATGDATITIDGTQQTITHIYLQDDGGDDDFGIQVDSQLDYNAGDATTWTGSLTIDVPFSDFTQGTYTEKNDAGYAATGGTSLVINPEPGSLLIGGITGVGMAFCAVRRSRRRRQPERDATASEETAS